jgi:plastocyanin
LCGCKCYPEGQTPEELNGTLCGINCLGEFNVTGCKVVDNACKEVYVGENNSETNGEEGAWITVLNESKTYDLLQLTGVEELVSSADLGAGSYNIIRLQISNVSVVMNGQTQEAKLPSGKIDINIAFMVSANKSSIVKLDFNLNDSLHITGDGQIIMAPVIKVDVSRDVELNITNGKINRIRAEMEIQKEVGMDENGSVGEGKRIRADLNLTIGQDGQIRVQEREQGGQQNQSHTPQQYDVSARINGFTPSTITVKVGDTVRWVFRDQFAHRLVSDAAGFDSMARYQDQVWTYTFNNAGTFAYHDSLNANAQGTIIVEQ